MCFFRLKVARMPLSAANERLLLKTYCGVNPRQRNFFEGDGQFNDDDNVSIQILTKFHPVILADYTPQCSVGDGNCLYRSVSLALYGSQQFHPLIRLHNSFRDAGKSGGVRHKFEKLRKNDNGQPSADTSLPRTDYIGNNTRVSTVQLTSCMFMLLAPL